MGQALGWSPLRYGSIGKTRLAVAAASAVQTSFLDGALPVDLATVSDPAQVLVAVGCGLGLLNVTQESAFDRVGDVVRDRVLLAAGGDARCVRQLGAGVARTSTS